MINGNLALAGVSNVDTTSMTTTKSSKSQGLDFGSIMSQSLSTKANSKDSSLYTDVSSLQKNTGSQTSGSKDNGTQSAVTTGTSKDSGNATSDGKAVGSATGNGNGTVNQASARDGDNAVSATDEIKEALANLKEEIKKTLGVTDDELESAMENLGLTMTDLLNPNKLTELVADLTNRDGVMSLITDSDLAEQLKHLLDAAGDTMDGLADKLQVTPERLQDLVKGLDVEDFDDALKAVRESVDDTGLEGSDAQDNGLNQITDAQQRDDATNDDAASQNAFSSNDEGSAKDEGHNLGDYAKNSADSLSNIATNILESVEQVVADNVTEGLNQVNAVDIVQQIMDNVKVMTQEKLQSIEMQLNPENLGSLHLTITAKDGVMTAQITAQDEAVKRAIETQLSVLKENFDNQGLKVESVEVTVESHRFEQGQDMGDQGQRQEQSSRRGRRISARDLAELGIGIEEPDETPEILAEGSSVSYRA